MSQLGQTPEMAPYYEMPQPVSKIVVRKLNFYYGAINPVSLSTLFNNYGCCPTAACIAQKIMPINQGTPNRNEYIAGLN